ncbi:MAG: S8 family serine peptidase [Candidatus Eisenbacteria bacterium]|nr:S8 family serine peptidase [Candidatus Eisenbacteria bacterium]
MNTRNTLAILAPLALFASLAAPAAGATDPWSPQPREGEVLSSRLDRAPKTAEGDRKAWVFFTDKAIPDEAMFRIAASRFAMRLDARSMVRRQKMGRAEIVGFHDLPVHQEYVDQVLALGANKRALSRYLNGVSVSAPLPVLRAIAELPFVRSIEPVRAFSRAEVAPDRPRPAEAAAKRAYSLDYGPSLGQLEMMQIPPLHDEGYDGTGMRVCLLDTGFKRTHESLQNVVVIAERDFINDDGNTSEEPGDPPGQFAHGTKILSLIAGYKPGSLIGSAYGAEFLLAKTEDTSQEQPIEEDWWVEGIEWADSMGADVASSSLGYSDWYTYQDMDGNTATTTIAADLAAWNGILVCTSAGNEGSSDWRYVTAPADADTIVAVGAVWSDTVIASFSSRGPTFDGRVKPELVAQGVYAHSADPYDDQTYSTCHGTSCSNPLLAGAATLVLQGNPFLTPYAVIAALKTTATRSESPDTAYGWGLVQAEDALYLVTSVRNQDDLVRWGGKLPPAEKTLELRASPNPFNPTVSFSVQVRIATNLRIRLYDARGALVDTLFNDAVAAGEHEVVWSGTDREGKPLPSGVYFAQAECPGVRVTEKLTLVR